MRNPNPNPSLSPSPSPSTSPNPNPSPSPDPNPNPNPSPNQVHNCGPEPPGPPHQGRPLTGGYADVGALDNFWLGLGLGVRVRAGVGVRARVDSNPNPNPKLGALDNFWRSAENLRVNGTLVWAASQVTVSTKEVNR